MSARLKVLEDEFGGLLFTRGRRVALTALGESFLPFARRALEVLEEGVEVARRAQVGQRGCVRLASLGSLAGGLLGPALAAFAREHPEVECVIRSGNHERVVSLLLDGVVDLGLVTWPAPRQERPISRPSSPSRSPYRRPAPSGQTELVLEPLEFLRRLAALVPPPRVNLVRFFGFFAPNASLRKHLVPKPPKQDPSVPAAPSPTSTPASTPATKYRVPWAQLLQRTFATDVLSCDKCGRPRRVVACVFSSTVAREILQHLRLPSRQSVPGPLEHREAQQLPRGRRCGSRCPTGCTQHLADRG